MVMVVPSDQHLMALVEPAAWIIVKPSITALGISGQSDKN
jgi:hypothetical protein